MKYKELNKRQYELTLLTVPPECKELDFEPIYESTSSSMVRFSAFEIIASENGISTACLGDDSYLALIGTLPPGKYVMYDDNIPHPVDSASKIKELKEALEVIYHEFHDRENIAVEDESVSTYGIWLDVESEIEHVVTANPLDPERILSESKLAIDKGIHKIEAEVAKAKARRAAAEQSRESWWSASSYSDNFLSIDGKVMEFDGYKLSLSNKSWNEVYGGSPSGLSSTFIQQQFNRTKA